MYFHPVKSIDINQRSKKLMGLLQIQQENKINFQPDIEKKLFLLCIKPSSKNEYTKILACKTTSGLILLQI